MITREQIVAEARTWINTPYAHHQRCKGAGVDCALLVAGISIELGLIDEKVIKKIPSYSTEWHLHNREEKLQQALVAGGCVLKSLEDRVPGDILVFRYGRVGSHLGIMAYFEDKYPTYIHAAINNTKVVELRLSDEFVKERLIAVYSFPGVE